jgi:hypothetical protein
MVIVDVEGMGEKVASSPGTIWVEVVVIMAASGGDPGGPPDKLQARMLSDNTTSTVKNL